MKKKKEWSIPMDVAYSIANIVNDGQRPVVIWDGKKVKITTMHESMLSKRPKILATFNTYEPFTE